MTGFELQTSGFGSGHSTNWTTTTTHDSNFKSQFIFQNVTRKSYLEVNQTCQQNSDLIQCYQIFGQNLAAMENFNSIWLFLESFI